VDQILGENTLSFWSCRRSEVEILRSDEGAPVEPLRHGWRQVLCQSSSQCNSWGDRTKAPCATGWSWVAGLACIFARRFGSKLWVLSNQIVHNKIRRNTSTNDPDFWIFNWFVARSEPILASSNLKLCPNVIIQDVVPHVSSSILEKSGDVTSNYICTLHVLSIHGLTSITFLIQSIQTSSFDWYVTTYTNGKWRDSLHSPRFLEVELLWIYSCRLYIGGYGSDEDDNWDYEEPELGTLYHPKEESDFNVTGIAW